MAIQSAAEANPPKNVEKAKPGDLCVVDLGKHSRKLIRKLRKGDGKLMTRAEQVVQNLKDEGVLAKDANTVVLVVRQKSGLRALLD